MKYILYSAIIGFLAVSCNSNSSSDTPDLRLPTAADTLDSTRQNMPASLTRQAVMFQGHDIRATGNEPFWMLHLIKDSALFQLIELQEYRQLLPEPVLNTPDSVRYLLHTVDDILDILITNNPCTDDMSGFKRRFTATVHIKRKTSEITYRGCADYISEYSKAPDGHGK